MSIMLPLYRIATGFLIVSLGLKINGFDLLVDVVGWFLVASGLSRMEQSVDPVFGKARISAIVAGVISCAELIGLTANPVIDLLDTLSTQVAIWLVAEGIIVRARTFGDASTASTFNALRWVLATVAAVGFLMGQAKLQTRGLEPLVLILAIVGFIAIVWFIVSLYRSARLPYLGPPQARNDTEPAPPSETAR